MQSLPIPSVPPDQELPGLQDAVVTHDRENARLQALDNLDVLDTPKEEAFDRVTRLAKKLFSVPISAVSFIDAHRQWYKSCQGLLNDETPREHTFCRHMLDTGQPLVVPDATQDARFAQNPYVAGNPGIRFYAGIPLKTDADHIVGSLCVVDTKPREFSEGQVDLLRDLAEMAMDELQLRMSASKDILTGALSRRAFKEELARAAALALRHHHDLALIAFDLDRFKEINDTFGHAAGDFILARAAKACQLEIRETDMLGRLGGEEFGVLLPNTGLTGAMGVAEKLRAAIQGLKFEDGAVKATASFGVAAMDTSTRDAHGLLSNADKACYQAKEAGRNRIVAYRPPAGATAIRRRVLKGGQIVFNGGMSSIDCTVRSISDEGAGIDVNSSLGVPKSFDLVIRADHFEKHARVVSQSERHIEVAFS